MANQDQELQVNLILLEHIRYYLFRIPSEIFPFRPLLFLIGSSHRKLDSRWGSITILFPRARRSFRSLWVHRSRIPEDSPQDITDKTSRVAGHFQELTSAPNCRLEKSIQKGTWWQKPQNKELGQHSYFSLLRTVPSRNTQKWESFTCSLPLLV
jgi:hypothetical protein